MSLATLPGPLSALLAADPSRAVLGMAVTSLLPLVPLTQVNPLYGISVGYGASVAVVAFALRAVVQPRRGSVAASLNGAALVYGVRLAVFLWARQALQWRPMKQMDMARWKRVVFSGSLAIFYACQMTPLMFVMKRKDQASPSLVEFIGLALTWSGLALEAIADGHKSWVKSQAQQKKKDDTFVGPTGGVYSLVRHPNYLGEVLFWWGTGLTAIPSLATSFVGWTCSVLGWSGIGGIMLGATASLEYSQQEKYGNQANFQEWKARVPYPWIPLYKGPAPKQRGAK